MSYELTKKSAGDIVEYIKDGTIVSTTTGLGFVAGYITGASLFCFVGALIAGPPGAGAGYMIGQLVGGVGGGCAGAAGGKKLTKAMEV